MSVQGVEATEKLISFMFDVMDLCAKKVVNGHVSLGLWDVMPMLGAAAAALHDVANVPEEVKNMTPADKMLLEGFVMERFKLEPPAVQQAIQAAIDAISALMLAYGFFKRPAS